MKQSKFSQILVLSSLLLGASVAISSCENKDIEHYENKAFVSSARLSTLLLKGNDALEQQIRTSIARPERVDQSVTYRVDASYVSVYNDTYLAEAVMLPGDNYELVNPKSTIVSGAVEGSPVTVQFKGLNALDRETLYVLPIVVSEATMPYIMSSKVVYYVIKAGALINTVANTTKNYLALQDASRASSLNGLNQLTMEAYVYVDKFGKLISTLMGIEGVFLVRIGDAGVPDDQIQLATSSGNVTHTDWRVPQNRWVHIAVTFNREDGATNVYIDGVKKGATQYSEYRNTVNWGQSSFYVGRSWDNNRWFEGSMSELRVWNKVLTPEELNAKDHFYIVSPDSEGLVAYWKFDEGSGSIVRDHTENATNLSAKEALTWKGVELPQQ